MGDAGIRESNRERFLADLMAGGSRYSGLSPAAQIDAAADAVKKDAFS
jgi:hypothetical protein